jgi:hypothetical protein
MTSAPMVDIINIYLHVTYDRCKISYTFHRTNALTVCCPNGLAYFAAAVSYKQVMFMKHVPGGCRLDVEEDEFSRHRLKN